MDGREYVATTAIRMNGHHVVADEKAGDALPTFSDASPQHRIGVDGPKAVKEETRITKTLRKCL
jgi:hypothetical protein